MRWTLPIALTLLAACGRDFQSFRPAFDGGGDATPLDVARPDALDVFIRDARDVSSRDAQDGSADTGDAATLDACTSMCSGACVDLQTDVQHCGTCANACPAAPANGDSQCVSGACVIRCNSGFHVCNGVCYADNDPMHCGTSCDVCPPPAGGGAAVCDAGACNITCAAGTHPCGNHCADDSSTTECGSSCTPCVAPPGGTVACMNGACALSCTNGATPCPSGSGGTPTCLTMSDPNACGSTCLVCTAPANGTAGCSLGACTFVCDPGFHSCASGACAVDDDPTQCGANCTACAAPANGTATCVLGQFGSTRQCGVSCDPGYHACGLNCYADDDVRHCGTSCNNCNSPANGSAVCTAGTCGIACDSGFHVCGSDRTGNCMSDTDTRNCGIGSACGRCPSAPNNGTEICSMGGSTCETVCDPGWYLSGGSCREADNCGVGPASITLAPGQMVTINGTFNNMANDQTVVCGAGTATSAGPDVVYQVTVTAGHTLTAVERPDFLMFNPRIFIASSCNFTTALSCQVSSTMSAVTATATAGATDTTFWVWADSGASTPASATFTVGLASN